MIATDFNSKTRVLTVTASGEVSHKDYHDMMFPAVDAAAEADGGIRLLYVFTEQFDNFSARAALDDAQLGIKHLKDFEAIAVVTDHAWIRSAVTAFSVFIPAALRTFALADLDAARQWLQET